MGQRDMLIITCHGHRVDYMRRCKGDTELFCPVPPPLSVWILPSGWPWILSLFYIKVLGQQIPLQKLQGHWLGHPHPPGPLGGRKAWLGFQVFWGSLCILEAACQNVWQTKQCQKETAPLGLLTAVSTDHLSTSTILGHSLSRSRCGMGELKGSDSQELLKGSWGCSFPGD